MTDFSFWCIYHSSSSLVPQQQFFLNSYWSWWKLNLFVIQPRSTWLPFYPLLPVSWFSGSLTTWFLRCSQQGQLWGQTKLLRVSSSLENPQRLHNLSGQPVLVVEYPVWTSRFKLCLLSLVLLPCNNCKEPVSVYSVISLEALGSCC